MYRPRAFREDRLEVLHALIRSHPLATLVTAGAQGLAASLVPFSLVAGPGRGVLRAHLARANEQLDALRDGATALAVFHGPQAYVSPSWYPSKAETGEVVPTWNYVVVQAWGPANVIDDAGWLRAQIDALTLAQEGHRAVPWQVDDAPAGFIAAQIKDIVGLEIPVDRIEGKWKVSQNRTPEDRRGVAEGFRAEGEAAMASLVDFPP